MADIAGAKAAIRARLVAGWTQTPITFQNEKPDKPWPPVDGQKRPQPWVNLEIITLPGEMRGAGMPGQQIWVYPGFIYVHVFAPTGSGDAEASEMAVAIGELFRGDVFYQQDGSYVRSFAPSLDGGGSGDDNGNWFRVTMSCPFEYWHRG